MADVILVSVLPKLCSALDEIRALAGTGTGTGTGTGSDETGAICTLCEVADFATDLVGHITDEAERS